MKFKYWDEITNDEIRLVYFIEPIAPDVGGFFSCILEAPYLFYVFLCGQTVMRINMVYDFSFSQVDDTSMSPNIVKAWNMISGGNIYFWKYHV